MNYSHYPYKNSHSDVPSFLSCKLHQIAILEPFYWVLIHINPPLESLDVAEVDVLSLDNGEASLAAGAPHPEA